MQSRSLASLVDLSVSSQILQRGQRKGDQKECAEISRCDTMLPQHRIVSSIAIWEALSILALFVTDFFTVE